MIAVSFISKLRRLKRRFICEFKTGHKWVVLMSPENEYGDYDVLLECKRCGKRKWVASITRLSNGTILIEV